MQELRSDGGLLPATPAATGLGNGSTAHYLSKSVKLPQPDMQEHEQPCSASRLSKDAMDKHPLHVLPSRLAVPQRCAVVGALLRLKPSLRRQALDAFRREEVGQGAIPPAAGSSTGCEVQQLREVARLSQADWIR